MPAKQNPTVKGRVLWNSLVGASTESITLSAYRAQHLIGSYGIRTELGLVEPTGARHRNPSGWGEAVIRIPKNGRAAL